MKLTVVLGAAFVAVGFVAGWAVEGSSGSRASSTVAMPVPKHVGSPGDSVVRLGTMEVNVPALVKPVVKTAVVTRVVGPAVSSAPRYVPTATPRRVVPTVTQPVVKPSNPTKPKTITVVTQ